MCNQEQFMRFIPFNAVSPLTITFEKCVLQWMNFG